MTEEEIAALQAQAEKATQLEADLAETRKEAAARRVALKEFEGIDVDEYKALKESAKTAEQASLESAGKWEEAKAAIVSGYEEKLTAAQQKAKDLESKYKKAVVNDAIVSTAAKLNAINPSQISMLLRDNIRLNENNEVEVINKDGKPTFNEKGDLLKVDDYVSSFLTENKYLVKGVEAGTGSAGGEHKAPAAELSGQDRLARGLENLLKG